jgi:SagB-type dehydrogenase family enzyme
MSTGRGEGALKNAFDLWSLREDVQVELEPPGGPVHLRIPCGEITIQRPTSPVREALSRMTLGPVCLNNVMSREYPAQWTQLVQVLDQLQPYIIRTLGLGTGQPLLSVMPLTPQSRFRLEPLPPDAGVRLSTFAALRTNGREYLLESPLAAHRVLLHRAEAVWLVGLLGRPATVATWADALPQFRSIAPEFLAYLAAAGMVALAEPVSSEVATPAFPEDSDPALAGWSQLDLAFHARRTRGRHDCPLGITYPLGKAGSPQPVIKPQAAEGIALHRPRWEDLAASDVPLAAAMECRRSIRRYDDDPPTAMELGDLLYRTARVRSLITLPSSAPSRPDGAERVDPRLSDRPYPGGGACYELELYVTVGHCAGIPSGIYHYDPLGHRLEPVTMERRAVDGLLLRARRDAAMDVPPPILITMTARFQRLSWKYEGLEAYA